jgi:hypothetical protein
MDGTVILTDGVVEVESAGLPDDLRATGFAKTVPACTAASKALFEG